MSSSTVTVNLFGMRGASVDITERKQAELEAARHRQRGWPHLSRRERQRAILSVRLRTSLTDRSAPFSAMRKLHRECSLMAAWTSPSFAKFLMNIVSEDKRRRRSHLSPADASGCKRRGCNSNLSVSTKLCGMS